VSSEVFLYDYVRTPFGKYGGALASVRPDDLGAWVIAQLIQRSSALDPASIGEVIFGNANGAGEENRNVARMSSLLAGLPVSVPGLTVNRLCGSGLEAAITGYRQIALGELKLVVAGGVESMTRAPWVVPKAERPYPTGDAALISTTLGWRLVNSAMPKEWVVPLGIATEQLATRYQITREEQDKFAANSHHAAARAWQTGHYSNHVVAVPMVELSQDEAMRASTSVQRLGELLPAFEKDGTITAGNASPLSDGAAALLLGNSAVAQELGQPPLAQMVSSGLSAGEPQLFGYAPVAAANQAISRAGITWADVGAVELNEAFAAQSLACIRAWDVDPAIVNAWGGAIAIGHPLGASGARVLGTLAHRLVASNQQWGVAAICIGVGQGLAVVLENVRE
jgi:acetyl-CoA acetyltransferase family protein